MEKQFSQEKEEILKASNEKVFTGYASRLTYVVALSNQLYSPLLVGKYSVQSEVVFGEGV